MVTLKAATTAIRKLNRDEAVKILTDSGFQCSDEMSLSVLQDAIGENIMNGLIKLEKESL